MARYTIRHIEKKNVSHADSSEFGNLFLIFMVKLNNYFFLYISIK